MLKLVCGDTFVIFFSDYSGRIWCQFGIKFSLEARLKLLCCVTRTHHFGSTRYGCGIRVESFSLLSELTEPEELWGEREKITKMMAREDDEGEDDYSGPSLWGRR